MNEEQWEERYYTIENAMLEEAYKRHDEGKDPTDVDLDAIVHSVYPDEPHLVEAFREDMIEILAGLGAGPLNTPRKEGE